jgi:hypothetical protein
MPCLDFFAESFNNDQLIFIYQVIEDFVHFYFVCGVSYINHELCEFLWLGKDLVGLPKIFEKNVVELNVFVEFF